MANYFYRTFVVSILSGSMLSFQMTNVIAETSTGGAVTTDVNGVVTSTKTHQFDKVNDADMLASLGMLAGGFVTGRMLAVYKPRTPDVMVAAAGGVAFIAGEIMSNVKFKGTIKAMEMEVSKSNDGKINEAQVQRLEDLKKSYLEAKNATKTKKNLQLASAAAFGVAAIMAKFFVKKEMELARACDMATVQGLAAVGTCPEAVVNPGEKFLCAECTARISTLQAEIKSVAVKREVEITATVVSDSTIGNEQKKLLAEIKTLCAEDAASPSAKAAAAAIGVACLAMVESNMNLQTSGTAQALSSGYFQDTLYKTLFISRIDPVDYELLQSREMDLLTQAKKVLNFFIAEADAGSWLPLLGMGASTAASFYLINKQTALSLDRWMFVPSHRAIAFAGLGALAYMASRSSDNVISKIDDNIKKIDQILNDINRLQNGIKMKSLIEKAINLQAYPLANKDYQLFSEDGKTITPCMTGNSTTNCDPLADQLKSIPEFVNLPESLKTTAMQAVKMGDGLSGAKGLSGQSLGGIQDLGNKQAAIARLLKKGEGKTTKLVGKKNNESEKKAETFLKGLNDGNGKALQRGGITPSQMMASIGATPIQSNLSDKGKDPSEELNKGHYVGDASSGALSGGAKKDGRTDEFDLKFNEAGPKEVASNEAKNVSDPEYEIMTNEINTDTGPSLFELISSRYLKSGYPKLLEEESVKN